MSSSKARLIVSVCLFLAWLAFLGFLVAERNSIVLSPPQFALARAIIVAEIREGDSTLVKPEIAWCAKNEDREFLSKQVVLPELLSCGKAQGFVGAGRYIIPLNKPFGYFEIAPINPGTNRNFSHAGLYIKDGGPRTEIVIKRLVEYAKEKPERAKYVTLPLIAPMVHGIMDRIRWPDVEPEVHLKEVELTHRLPIEDARGLRDDLLKLGAKAQLMHIAEVRIYPETSQTRRQLDSIVAAKAK